jgi:phosphatidylserine decarboxylase
MKRLLFFPAEISYLLLATLIWSLFALGFYKFFISFLLFLILGFFFRRNRISFQDTIKPDGEMYISPIHGKIESIRQNVPVWGDLDQGHEVRITMSVNDEKGLYLPLNGEVTFLKANKGIKISRNSESQHFYGPLEEVSHTDLILSSRNETKTQMRYIDSPYCPRPSLWMKLGDRGRSSACFGYYPFGGTLLIYLPINSEILVYEGERVKPGQTVIAVLKDEK